MDGWGTYGDTDPTDAKFYILENRSDPEVRPYFELDFGKVPAEQLYN